MINGADDRNARIRQVSARMRELIAERNKVGIKIRDLHSEIAKELGIPRPDFIAAMRLQDLAISNRERTLGHVREILFALGAIAVLPEPSPLAVPNMQARSTYTSEVLAALTKAGPMKGADIATATGLNVHHVGVILRNLNNQKKIIRFGKLWSAR